MAGAEGGGGIRERMRSGDKGHVMQDLVKICLFL